MSPRKPAVLRDDSGQNLRDYLIETAARLIDQRGSAGLAVRDIAREAKVADGVLYNYFEDKEDLLVHALLAHVAGVMAGAQGLLPPPGEGTVAENLRVFIDGGIANLLRVTPAFAGLMSQPKVLARFHAMVGGDAAFDPAAEDAGEAPEDDAGVAAHDGGEAPEDDAGEAPEDDAGEAAHDGGGAAGAGAGRPASGHAPPGDDNDGPGDDNDGPGEGRGLPALLTAYLAGEQRLGRIDAAADIDAAASLVVGAMHGQILPRVLFAPPGAPVTIPPGLSARLAGIVLHGIAPGAGGP
jgi:AcrR family transcriptional regulator